MASEPLDKILAATAANIVDQWRNTLRPTREQFSCLLSSILKGNASDRSIRRHFFSLVRARRQELHGKRVGVSSRYPKWLHALPMPLAQADLTHTYEDRVLSHFLRVHRKESKACKERYLERLPKAGPDEIQDFSLRRVNKGNCASFRLGADGWLLQLMIKVIDTEVSPDGTKRCREKEIQHEGTPEEIAAALPEIIKSLELSVGKTDLSAKTSEPSGALMDSHSITVRGKTHYLTDRQAEIVSVLCDEYLKGNETVHIKTIRARLKIPDKSIESFRVSRIFKTNPKAYEALIKKHRKRQGLYSLRHPEDFPSRILPNSASGDDSHSA